jgi:hypothetical protein
MTENTQWEYTVLSFGSILREPKNEEVEARLNELGMEGWEVVSSVMVANNLRVIAKRPLSRSTRRQRTMPG